MVNLCYIIGTAGSGKTVLTASLYNYLTSQGASVSVVNLDPAVAHIPYSADLDIRDSIEFNKLVDAYDLGPNGAMIAAVDLIADRFHEFAEEITDFGESSDMVLIDTPGQIELFAYRRSGQTIIDSFPDSTSTAMFLFDSALASDINGFISLNLLAASVQLRLKIGFIHVLTKLDLLTDEEKIEEILYWKENPYDAIENEKGMMRELLLGSAQVVMDTTTLPLYPVSALSGDGLELLGAELSRIFNYAKDWR